MPRGFAADLFHGLHVAIVQLVFLAAVIILELFILGEIGIVRRAEIGLLITLYGFIRFQWRGSITLLSSGLSKTATWAATASCSSGAKAGTGACAARAAAPDMSIVPPVDSSATRGAAPAEQANKSARTKPITIGSHVSTTRA